MAVIQVKKYKTIKENGNKVQVPKTKEEWNKETRNGTATWYFTDRYKLNDKVKQYKSAQFVSKREAKDEERIFSTDPIKYILEHSKRAKNNKDIIFHAKSYENKDKILDEYYNDFFEYDCKINKESTAYDHRRNYFKHISPILGKDNPKNIDISRINYFHEEIDKKDLVQNTKVNINSALVKFSDFLIRKGIVQFNYAKMYGSFKKINDEITPVEKKLKYQTLEEYEFFISNINELYWQTFFKFLFWHGLRKGEQQALRWSDIDFKNNVVKINKTISKSKTGGSKLTNTKNKKNRVILLAQQSIDVLKKYYEYCKFLDSFNDNWFVFGHGENIEDIIARNTIDRNIRKFYDILIAKYPNKKITILTHHEFGRHSHASYLLNVGMGRADIYDIIALRLGDTTEVIKSTYAHPYEDVNNDKTKELLNL